MSKKGEPLPVFVEPIEGGDTIYTEWIGNLEAVANGQFLIFRGREKDHHVKWYGSMASVTPDCDGVVLGYNRFRLAGIIKFHGAVQEFVADFPAHDTNPTSWSGIKMPHYPGNMDVLIAGDGRVYFPVGREQEFPKLAVSMGIV